MFSLFDSVITITDKSFSFLQREQKPELLRATNEHDVCNGCFLEFSSIARRNKIMAGSPKMIWLTIGSGLLWRVLTCLQYVQDRGRYVNLLIQV